MLFSLLSFHHNQWVAIDTYFLLLSIASGKIGCKWGPTVLWTGWLVRLRCSEEWKFKPQASAICVLLCYWRFTNDCWSLLIYILKRAYILIRSYRVPRWQMIKLCFRIIVPTGGRHRVELRAASLYRRAGNPQQTSPGRPENPRGSPLPPPQSSHTLHSNCIKLSAVPIGLRIFII